MNIDLGAHYLIQGELIIFPTETVYGLGGLLFNEQAVARIYAVKGRSICKPLSAMISHIDQVNDIAIDIPPVFFSLAKKFLPGPLTVVLKKHPNISDLVTGGQETIGIRISSHSVAQGLCQLVGEPLVVTSANLSGSETPSTFEDVLSHFKGTVKLGIEGQPHYGKASTVISLVHDKPLLLREGPIPFSEILKHT